MKNMFVLIIVAMTLCISTPAGVRADDENDVRKAVQDFGETMGHNDVPGMMGLTTADYSFINPIGALQTREQRFAPIKSGQLKYDSIKYEDVKVRVYGNAAVVTARVVVVGKNGTNDISGQFRSTLMLVKQSGKWLIVAAQSSQLQNT